MIAKIFVGFIIALLSYMIVFLRINKLKEFKLIDWSLISIGLFYGLGFSFVIWGTYNGLNIFYFEKWIFSFDSNTTLLYLLFNILFMVFLILGWHFSKKIFNKNIKINNGINTRYINKLFYSSIFILIISFLAYYLYARAYGGFLGVFKHNRAIRSGTVKINNKFSFLGIFGSFAQISSFVFAGIIFHKKNSKKFISIILFLFSFTFSIYVLSVSAGRADFLYYLMTFILAYFIINNKNYIIFSIKGVFLLILSIFILTYISNLIIGNYNWINLFVKELSFPFVAFVAQLNLEKYRWFWDLIIAPLFLLPEKIWGVQLGLNEISDLNTALIWGAPKGKSGVTSGMPLDLISFGISQGGFIGVIIIGFLWGSFLNVLEKTINKIKEYNTKQIIYSQIIIVVGKTTLYGYPLHFIHSNFKIIFGLLIIFIILKFKIRISGLDILYKK